MLLLADDLVDLARRLNRTTLEFRGFAYEGAAMALTLLDVRTLGADGCYEAWRARIRALWCERPPLCKHS
jgi:hypothetical protein